MSYCPTVSLETPSFKFKMLKKDEFVFLLLSCVCSCYILDISPLPEVVFAGTFFRVVVTLLWMVSDLLSGCADLLSLMWSHSFSFAVILPLGSASH